MDLLGRRQADLDRIEVVDVDHVLNPFRRVVARPAVAGQVMCG
jgi:hypothetical protein